MNKNRLFENKVSKYDLVPSTKIKLARIIREPKEKHKTNLYGAKIITGRKMRLTHRSPRPIKSIIKNV